MKNSLQQATATQPQCYGATYNNYEKYPATFTGYSPTHAVELTTHHQNAISA